MNGHKTKKNLLVINNHFCESITTANNNPGEGAIWGGVGVERLCRTRTDIWSDLLLIFVQLIANLYNCVI